ncbi:MAG: methyltransferase domain-containing protein [Pseudomonadota bacterium]
MTEAADWAGRMGRDWAGQVAALERQLEGVGNIGLAALAAKLGERVIDLGCGSGPTLASIAEAVGATGRATGVDISAELVAMARARIAGLTQAEVIEADAGTYVFESGYDALFSRFGCMFFDNPAAALGNLRAALRPGGRALLVVWSDPKANPWAAVPAKVADDILGPSAQPPVPGAPGPFAWAEEARFRNILKDAGFSEITAEEQAVELAVGVSGDGSPVQRATAVMSKVGPLARRIREAEETSWDLRIQKSALFTALGAALTPYAREGWVRMPGRIWLIRATA